MSETIRFIGGPRNGEFLEMTEAPPVIRVALTPNFTIGDAASDSLPDKIEFTEFLYYRDRRNSYDGTIHYVPARRTSVAQVATTSAFKPHRAWPRPKKDTPCRLVLHRMYPGFPGITTQGVGGDDVPTGVARRTSVAQQREEAP